ncbi:MAG: hypothetical protein KBS95_05915 [Alistipes sp.]|nr:hypothetical protein [Candidatus Alistipes equi]
MARKNTTDVDFSVAEKIRALYELQKIDSQIDEINKVKGALPDEVKELEDTIEGLNTRKTNIQSAIDNLKAEIKLKKRTIEEAKKLIESYSKQSDNVRNNRELVTLEEEIEFQKLEIVHAEKNITSATNEIEFKKTALADVETAIVEKKKDLDVKLGELNNIDVDTEPVIKELSEKALEKSKMIDDRLLGAYNRIRSKVRNGLAVVTIQRDACSGCFNRIPSQRQADIRQSKRIIVCEYCGRILAPDDEQIEQE